MDFYRGDDRPPHDPVLSTRGFTAKPPAQTMSGDEARAFLQNMAGGPAEIGMVWRSQTPGGLIATSMIEDGAFTQFRHFYKITIPDEEITLRLLTRRKTLGANVQHSSALSTRDYFVLFNNGNYDAADLIGFCHGQVQSKEVTFLTAIPARYIAGFRQSAYTGRPDVPFIPFRRLGDLPRKGLA
ncbi:hypothetical protein [Sphingomonas oligoaromativorans]|uniref:hypothetical protein n=1 Tax=Sphingomonas oligoaromativorans TaxID=575322 RepID=UPI001ABB61C7|nr:hypothetical protein [Sphingomonas oligoaromativorans]NIJ34623.1 hypothetical protein [Sphingomonas oligoaromativorans]